MSTGRQGHSDREGRSESAREDAELAALEAQRYPSFRGRQFLKYFGIGLVAFSYGTWSLWSYDFEHQPFPGIQAFAVLIGVFLLVSALAGRRLQTLEDRKQRTGRP